MNACCNDWMKTVEPLRPHEGRFIETRTCPSCQTVHQILFVGEVLLGAAGTKNPIVCVALTSLQS